MRTDDDQGQVGVTPREVYQERYDTEAARAGGTERITRK